MTIREKTGLILEEDLNRLKARIQYLERANRGHFFAMELLATLGELHGNVNKDRDFGSLFGYTRKYLKQLVNFQTMGFFLVDEAGSGFELKDWEPAPAETVLKEEADRQIEKGSFALALKQNRALLVGENPAAKNLILHALIAKSRVLGMFIGKFEPKAQAISAEQLNLITIILHNTAYAVENAALYKIVSEKNVSLEQRVQERTRELEEQTLELKQEIVERKRAEHAYERLSRKTVSILLSAGEGIVGLDMEGKITFVNPAAAQMAGYKPEEFIGQSLHDLLHHSKPDGGPYSPEDCPIQRVLKDRISCHGVEEIFWKKDRSEFPIEYHCSPIKEKENVVGAVVTFRDITSRKKAEEELKNYAEELQRSNQELQDFAFIASHDLQEPLRKVIMFGSRLKSNYEDVLDERARDYLERMEKAAGRMQKLMDELLQLSRITTKAKPFEPTPLKEVISEVLSDLEVRVSRSKARIEVGDLPTLDADRVQMQQLFQNLINNAMKFHNSGEPPDISIDAQDRERGFWEIRVKDNGIGFEHKYLDRIFKPFERLHGRSEFEGSGMGLAICQKIVTRHGGTITAESTPQKGTTFIITLPEKH